MFQCVKTDILLMYFYNLFKASRDLGVMECRVETYLLPIPILCCHWHQVQIS